MLRNCCACPLASEIAGSSAGKPFVVLGLADKMSYVKGKCARPIKEKGKDAQLKIAREDAQLKRLNH